MEEVGFEHEHNANTMKMEIDEKMNDTGAVGIQQDLDMDALYTTFKSEHTGQDNGMGEDEATKEDSTNSDVNVKAEPVEKRASSDSEEPAQKKPCLEINIRKLLPDLEKHWKTVEEDPNDFTAWTYLLQYVDQENELLAAREAYDAFLSKYPYCYGYWKKYADYEKRRGSASDCEQVFRRGLKAVSLSVDLWIHYLNYAKATHEKDPDYIRAQFEAAITACGMEFRSDKLWEHYIHWEKENENLKNVLAIYDRVIAMPTQSHAAHYQHLVELITQTPPSDILSQEELEDIIQIEKFEKIKKEEDSDEIEESKIRERILERRSEAYKKNESEVALRWSYEEAIKRPYFHVKPLEKGQLKIWKEYLDFEVEKGNYARIVILFERCLIACALYEEYWIKFAKFLQMQDPVDVEKLRDVFTRASTIHHQKKPWIHLHWASFEESQGNHSEVISILENLEKQFPDSLHVQCRRINFERRIGNYSKCDELFQKYIQNTKSKPTTGHIVIKYARFLSEVMNDFEAAKKRLLDNSDFDEGTRGKAIMAILDMAIQRKPLDVDLVLATFDEALKTDLPEERKLTLAHRRIEFLEDYSPDMLRIEKAQQELQTIAKTVREKKSSEASRQEDSKDASGGTTYPDSTQQNGSSFGGQQYNQYDGQYSNWNASQSTGYSNNTQGWSAYQGYYA